MADFHGRGADIDYVVVLGQTFRVGQGCPQRIRSSISLFRVASFPSIFVALQSRLQSSSFRATMDFDHAQKHTLSCSRIEMKYRSLLGCLGIGRAVVNAFHRYNLLLCSPSSQAFNSNSILRATSLRSLWQCLKKIHGLKK